MPWFKVDDSFHSHPKALAAGPAALGLWVLAGSWSSANAKGGFVPDYVLPRLTEDSATLARKLVTAGLWTRTKNGYKFHDWNGYNPSAVAVRAIRTIRSDAGKQANHVRWHVNRGVKDDDCEWCAEMAGPA